MMLANSMSLPIYSMYSWVCRRKSSLVCCCITAWSLFKYAWISSFRDCIKIWIGNSRALRKFWYEEIRALCSSTLLREKLMDETTSTARREPAFMTTVPFFIFAISKYAWVEAVGLLPDMEPDCISSWAISDLNSKHEYLNPKQYQ